MKIHVFTAVCGSKLCNLQCPYCVSKMTPSVGVDSNAEDVNWRNFKIACQFALRNGVNTALITSKGETLLYPEVCGNYIQACAAEGFPFIEIQTNGLCLLEMERLEALKRLRYWREQGLTLVCISIAHWQSFCRADDGEGS